MSSFDNLKSRKSCNSEKKLTLKIEADEYFEGAT